MRRHAKASTAGSTQRWVRGLSRIYGGVFATHGASPDGSESSVSATRGLILSLTAIVAILATMTLFVAPANAIKVRLFKETFGSAAQPSFDSARGIAVDQSTGDVLVMDAGGTPSIKRYNPDGTPADFSALGTNVIDGLGTGDETPEAGLGFASPAESQIAVDNSGGATDGNIYVTQSSPNAINVFSEDGEFLGQLSESSGGAFSEACGVAVDPSGAVYVGDYSSGIHKFVPAANPPVNADNTATFSTGNQPCTLAAGAGPTAGYLFAVQYVGPVSKLDSSTGEVKYEVSSGSTMTASADPGTGHVFAAIGTTVKELDASGAGSATVVSRFELASPVQGVAARTATGDVFISRLSHPNVEVFGAGGVAFPDVTTTAPTALAGTAATLNGTVNPDGEAITACEFEWGTSTSYGGSAPCVPDAAGIGSGTGPVAVHADLSGLNSGTVYHYRLKAVNANGAVVGEDMSLLTLGPVIADQWTVSVVRTEATVKARINPGGSATTFHVEYGTSAAYGSETAESSVGSDSADHTVTAFLDGLVPGTTYHYRVVATNVNALSEGPDRTFKTFPPIPLDTDCPNQAARTGPAAQLPDCRAYEMVSPVDKNGGDIYGIYAFNPTYYGGFVQGSLSGEKITYSSPAPFGDQVSGTNANQYLATRGASGWSTHGLNPPLGPTVFPEIIPARQYYFDSAFQGFSDDLSTAWLVNGNKVPLTSQGANGVGNLYRRDNLSGTYRALTINEPTTFSSEEYGRGLGLEFRLASADGNHEVFDAEAAFTANATATANRQVYDLSGGQLHLVSVLPDGSASPGFSYAGTNAQPYNNFYDGEDSRFVSLKGAVSEDGSRIFWSSAIAPDPPKLYMRENPAQEQSAINGSGECTEPAKACTIEVSTSGEARFWAADPEASTALFSQGVEDNEDLFAFDVETRTSTLIAHEVRGVLGASDDLSHVYFVSKEALAPGATAGGYNLYLDEEGTKTFIATLASGDVRFSEIPSLVNPAPFYHNSRVTPDGGHIAFQSSSKALSEAVAGYDNTDAVSGEPNMEVYTYEAGGDLVCVSCRPSGARPAGARPLKPYPETLERKLDYWAAAWIPTAEHELHPPRVLSDDGSRLFFNGLDALLPQDTNGVQDVYEWEAQGAGTCETPGGCLSLITTGESTKESEFVDADTIGEDVFIRTSESIDPRDPGAIDIYDVRAGGGFVLPPSPPDCIGDACQSPAQAPNDATPASAGFRGAGNQAARRLRRSCRPRSRHTAKRSGKAKHKKAKRCKRTNRRAGR